jgi:predicted GTPase
MGAAGSDFRNFNVCFGGNPAHVVVAFTAAQIPNIEGRTYPPMLAGPRRSRSFAVGSIRETFRQFPGIGPVLPAMGYGREMIRELAQTIKDATADLVILGTPIDLGRFLKLDKPTQRAHYELQEIGQPTLEAVLKARFPQTRVGP